MTFDALQWMLIAKLVVSAVCGYVIGWTRDHAGKGAGMRTFALVSLGSTLFTIIDEHGFGGIPHDGTRIVAQIVTGVGFIGAGMIFRQSDSLVGLTTAAGLWAAAAIGVSIGAGMWLLSLVSVILVVIILESKRWYFETKKDSSANFLVGPGSKRSKLIQNQNAWYRQRR